MLALTIISFFAYRTPRRCTAASKPRGGPEPDHRAGSPGRSHDRSGIEKQVSRRAPGAGLRHSPQPFLLSPASLPPRGVQFAPALPRGCRYRLHQETAYVPSQYRPPGRSGRCAHHRSRPRHSGGIRSGGCAGAGPEARLHLHHRHHRPRWLGHSQHLRQFRGWMTRATTSRIPRPRRQYRHQRPRRTPGRAGRRPAVAGA